MIYIDFYRANCWKTNAFPWSRLITCENDSQYLWVVQLHFKVLKGKKKIISKWWIIMLSSSYYQSLGFPLSDFEIHRITNTYLPAKMNSRYVCVSFWGLVDYYVVLLEKTKLNPLHFINTHLTLSIKSVLFRPELTEVDKLNNSNVKHCQTGLGWFKDREVWHSWQNPAVFKHNLSISKPSSLII